LSNRHPLPHGGKEKGFTLIESLVVLIIGIVVLSASSAGIGKLLRTADIATEISNITQIAANLRNIKSAADGYADINNELMVKLKLIPANMSQSADGTITNSWNGSVNITPIYGHNFRIDYNNVPAEACQQFALKLRGAGWTWFDVDDVSVRAGTRLGLRQIADMCKGGNKRIRLEGN
jgi:prepilin-type N-terminal cleavage/methylation domain-containing protein